MAAKKKDDPKTVTRYTSKGTKVTISEEKAERLGAGFSKTDPTKQTASKSQS